MKSENTMSRADLHCHSTASQVSKLGVQRALGLPECATPPEEVYELAKRRGMDFVTITDHDTIHGCLQIRDLPNTFISEQVTTHFPQDPCKIDILVWGISEEQHHKIEDVRDNILELQRYLQTAQLAHAVAHDDAALEAGVRQIEDLTSRERYPSGHVVPAVSRGLAAFERQDFSATIDALEPVIGELERIGGSRAQLDLVEFTLLKAYVGSDRLDDARRMVSERRRGCSSPPVAGLAALPNESPKV